MGICCAGGNKGVKVVLTTGREKGSKAVSVVRP